MKKLLLSLSIIMSVMSLSVAQTHKCGTDEVMEEAYKNDPSLRERRIKEEVELQKRLQNKKNAKTTTVHERQIIPVVFHIIHAYGAENVSEAQCLDALRVLNEDFQRRGADSNLIASAFIPIRGNTNLEFRLAKKDPNGNCTNGITRTYSELTFSANDNVKDLISWNTQKYLNIWIASNVYSGSSGNQVGGYAFYPCSAPSPNKEGVIVTHRQFGSIGTSNGNFAARTLPHEVGHALGLAHTWGSTNEPGVATNCDVDDGVTDTPNCIGVANQSCNLSQVTCGTLDNINNIMEYSSCARMFTEGQSDRMRAATDTVSGTCNYRKNLSTYANLVATGVNDGFVAACAPKADFDIISTQICQGSTLTFTDASYQAAVDTRLWRFEGGTPSIASGSTENVVYNTPGTYKVTLIVQNANGLDSMVRNAVVKVIPSPGTILAPYLEGIESTTWPVNSSSNSLLNWTEETTTSNNWERTTTAKVTGNASARVRLSLIPNTRVNSFISPVLDLSNIVASQNRLGFKIAYARKTTTGTGSADVLKVYFSTDCGKTWSQRYNKSGTALSTIGTSSTDISSSNFVPTASQWRTEIVSLTGIAGKSSVMMKFEATSNQGTILYVDDINIYSIVTGLNGTNLAEELQFGIYPNPSDGDATINFELTESMPITITVQDILGKTVGQTSTEVKNAGSHELSFNELVENPSSGVYIIRFSTDKGTFTKKFVKN